MPWAGEDLIRRMADGDADACGRFYDRYAPLVYPVILRVVGDADVAADVLREVFREAWEAAGAYDDRRSPDAWIVSRARARAAERAGQPPPLEPATASAPGADPGHEPFATHAVAYAGGALRAGERAQFEEHLARGCAACARSVRAHEERLADLAREAPAVAPPPGVKTELMRRVAASASPRTSWRSRRRLRWMLGSAAAVIGVAAFVAGLVASRYEARIGAMARETSRVRDDLRRQEAALRDRVAIAQGLVDLLLDPAARTVTLRGGGPSPAAVGRVIVNEAGGGYLLVANVPAAPSGQVYVLWASSDGPSRPAGSFRPDASGRATLAIAPIGGSGRAFTVTLEAEGAVAAPTGPVVLGATK